MSDTALLLSPGHRSPTVASRVAAQQPTKIMTRDKAEELRKRWGDKPCDHPDIIAECQTKQEKWRCVRCGRLVNYDKWEESRASSRNSHYNNRH